ncbi:hypothetical protein SAMN05421827_106206 [Pedobacter terrae]|uniref:Uncharacterized protein n=1 Tax=Pedobacter terrae TaxID=405671 RepID=A0A1G7U7Q0_9SPHI|nr:hypothetical protein SAMN05421827_106206 [Pedobacter terrae]
MPEIFIGSLFNLFKKDYTFTGLQQDSNYFY